MAEFANIATPPPLLMILSFLDARLYPVRLGTSFDRDQISCRHMIWGEVDSTNKLREVLFEEKFQMFHCKMVRLIKRWIGLGVVQVFKNGVIYIYG